MATGCGTESIGHPRKCAAEHAYQGELICEFLCDGEVMSCAFLDECRLVAGDAGGRVPFLQLEEPRREVH